MTTTLEPKRRPGLPRREKPKPVTPAFGKAAIHQANRDELRRAAEEVNPAAVRETVPVNAAVGTIEQGIVEVRWVLPSPYQPRQAFPEAEIRGLAASIVT